MNAGGERRRTMQGLGLRLVEYARRHAWVVIRPLPTP